MCLELTSVVDWRYKNKLNWIETESKCYRKLEGWAEEKKAAERMPDCGWTWKVTDQSFLPPYVFQAPEISVLSDWQKVLYKWLVG